MWLLEVSHVYLLAIMTVFSSAPSTRDEHTMEEEETGELEYDQHNLGE